jgi:hypothetical protein
VFVTCPTTALSSFCGNLDWFSVVITVKCSMRQHKSEAVNRPSLSKSAQSNEMNEDRGQANGKLKPMSHSTVNAERERSSDVRW